ncbi:MAG: Ig-like domain-containing protein [Methanoculleaceae archaeon]
MLIVIPGTVSAVIPDDLSVTHEPIWPAAGGEEITLQVTAYNQSNPVPGATVSSACLPDDEWGLISPQSAVTDETGTATFTFVTGTRAGTAAVRFSSGLCNRTYLIDIDHAAPDHIAGIEYQGDVEVGSTTTISLRLFDRYDNPIDSRNEVETVRFIAGVATPDAGFLIDGTPSETAVIPVDGDGRVTVSYRADTVPGDELIYIQPPDPIPPEYLVLHAMATGVPYAITSAVRPSGDPDPAVPADGESTFTITYTLYDRFGNPTANQTLLISSSESTVTPLTLRTNTCGMAEITYGPRDTTGEFTITARPSANQSLMAQDTLVFYSTEPVSMVLTASPQTLPSRDVEPDATAEIRAKVMDIQGNPVAGETVHFTLTCTDPHPASTVPPELSGSSAITDEDGIAAVEFHPGAFITPDDPGWLDEWATATDSCTVTAEWNGQQQTIGMAWKNYPYLSVETSISPETLEVNGTALVTIRLTGDGVALEPEPIDVVLAIDRSGSMLEDDPDRMHSAREAAGAFVDLMGDRDRVGIVSFGSDAGTVYAGGSYRFFRSFFIDNTYEEPQEYDEPAEWGSHLVYTTDTEKEALHDVLYSLVPDGGTPMRDGLYQAVRELVSNRRQGAVPAVILLTDGHWNTGGDPEGGEEAVSYPEIGTGSVIRWAADNQIPIYTIGLGDDVDGASLRSYADETGGTYYYAPAGAELAEIYTTIAGELRKEAAVNATMDISFATVKVNDQTLAGSDLLCYVWSPPDSTHIRSWNGTAVIRDEVIDQTADWQEDSTLSFDVGTISLGQIWETTIAFRVTHTGNIELFGWGSHIIFNEGEDELQLPTAFVTVVANRTDIGLNYTTLDIHNLRCTGNEPFTEFLPVEWDISYNGTEKVREEIAWSADGGRSWTTFDIRYTTADHDETALDLRGLPSGEYLIRVVATTPDSPGDTERLAAPVRVGQTEGAYIILE